MIDNSTILGDFYLTGSSDYMQRMPNPAQAGVAKTAKWMFSPMAGNIWNDFAKFMVNRIAFDYVHQTKYENDLREYEKQKIYYGDTVTETALNWIKAHNYDADAETQFKTYYPDGLQAFHSNPIRKNYPVSISREQLKRAFADEYGLNRLVAAIMQQPMNSDNYDNYITMLNLFTVADSEYKLFRHKVSAAPTTKETCQELLTAMQQYKYDITAPSSLYSCAGEIPVYALPEEVTCFIRSDAQAANDVIALANVFQLDKAEVPYRIKVVPKALWPLKETDYAILTTGDFFQVYTEEYMTTSQIDPEGLKTNYWLHDWRIVSFSPFVPVIVFSSAEGTVNDVVEVSPTSLEIAADSETVAAGGSVQLTLTLNGTVTPEAEGVEVAPDAATWEVTATRTGNDGDEAIALNSRTYVDSYNVLRVQKTGLKAGDKITCKATSTYIEPEGATPELTATHSVTVA